MIDVQSFDFYLNKKVTDEPIRLNQYDRKVPFKFNLYQPDGSAYIIGNDIPKIEMVVGSTIIIISTGITISSNSISFVIPREAALNSETGIFNVIVESIDGTERVGTFCRDIIVESNAIDENAASSALITSVIEDLQSNVTTATKAKNDLDQSIGNGMLANYVKISDLRALVVEIEHPVGSIKPFADTTDPNIKYPNTTWIQVGKGQVFVGVGTGTDKNTLTKEFKAGANVGEYQHKLTYDELGIETTKTEAVGYGLPVGGAGFGDRVMVTANNGIADAHNILPPTFGIYMWQRTA
ncbi:MAG: hypothetical protein Q8936_16745 [Bacillota bacterium]|nr:hypothetical protein [Bacillota bacterium]